MAVLLSTGIAWIVDKVQDVAPNSNSKMDWCATGTGAATETAARTVADLTEVSEVRTQGTLSQPSANTDRLVVTQAYTGTKTVTQFMRVNTGTKGGAGETPLMYALFTGIPVQSGDSIQFTADYIQS